MFSHVDEQWRSVDQSGWVDIQRAMDRRRASLLWKQAALHRHRSGLEDGADLTVARKHYCVLIKRGAMARAGALMAILTGALWPEARIQEEIKGKDDHDTKFDRCGHHCKDEEHMFWICPPTNATRKASIRRTNGKYFDHDTGAIDTGTPCYFLRASCRRPGPPCQQ